MLSVGLLDVSLIVLMLDILFQPDVSRQAVGMSVHFKMASKWLGNSMYALSVSWRFLQWLWCGTFRFCQTSLGGLRELQEQKNAVRKQHNLRPLPEDTYEVCRTMRPASPPASAADLIEQQAPRRGGRGGKRVSPFQGWIFQGQIWDECLELVESRVDRLEK